MLNAAEKAELERLRARLAELEALINAPEVDDFLKGVRLEAAHQCERWGVDHDKQKEPQDWFWLLGYLGGKALAAAAAGNRAKALHHCISSGAVLLNWHAHILGLRAMGQSPKAREALQGPA